MSFKYQNWYKDEMLIWWDNPKSFHWFRNWSVFVLRLVTAVRPTWHWH